jgi:hypothetical protein
MIKQYGSYQIIMWIVIREISAIVRVIEGYCNSLLGFSAKKGVSIGQGVPY